MSLENGKINLKLTATCNDGYVLFEEEYLSAYAALHVLPSNTGRFVELRIAATSGYEAEQILEALCTGQAELLIQNAHFA